MGAPFNDIMHGDSERLESILDIYGPMDEQELRAAIGNAVGMIRTLQAKVERLEERLGSK